MLLVDETTTFLTFQGKPPLWTPLQEPRRLNEDNGTYYRDRNAANCPRHPMEATVLAVLANKDDETEPDFDVLCCGSTLGNLIRFIRGEDRQFRMLVETVGNRVHLVRRENSPHEQLSDVRGYGHTFPEEYTTWEADVKGSTSHQRILSYSFGGLRFLTRFEADGYLGTGASGKLRAGNDRTLEEALSGFQIKSEIQTSDAPVTIASLKNTPIVSQSTIFDLKTRSIKRQDDDVLGQELPRLWVTQTPNFVLAFHERGVFRDIEVKNVKGAVQDWEMDNQESLMLLAQLLEKLVALARQKDRPKFELCATTPGQLDIREQTPEAGQMLSTETMKRWKDWLLRPDAEGETEEDTQSKDSDDASEWTGATYQWDEDDEKDYTACDKECGYCGRCDY